MAIRYTVAECEAEIVAIEAQIKALRGLPDAGEIGSDRVEGISSARSSLEAQLDRWTGRLLAARNGGVYLPPVRCL